MPQAEVTEGVDFVGLEGSEVLAHHEDVAGREVPLEGGVAEGVVVLRQHSGDVVVDASVHVADFSVAGALVDLGPGFVLGDISR